MPSSSILSIPAVRAAPSAISSTLITKERSGLSIFFEEVRACLTHLLPAAGVWFWEKYVVGSITTFSLQSTAEKVSQIAFLFQHKEDEKKEGSCQQPLTPLIFLHGDYGHPFYMLPLINAAKKKGHSVYSLYIPKVENNTYFEQYSQLLKQALEKIEALTGRKECLGVGHSKGAIHLAHRQFVELDGSLKATCAIAGRLSTPEGEHVLEGGLERIVKKIYSAILQNPSLPLMQIVPAEDWNASRESMAVRPEERCIIVPGMHLSGIFTAETSEAIGNFLTEFGSFKS